LVDAPGPKLETYSYKSPSSHKADVAVSPFITGFWSFPESDEMPVSLSVGYLTVIASVEALKSGDGDGDVCIMPRGGGNETIRGDGIEVVYALDARMSVELRPTGLELFLACLKLTGLSACGVIDGNMRFYFV